MKKETFSILCKFGVAQADFAALRSSLLDIGVAGEISCDADVRRFEFEGDFPPRRMAAMIAISIEAYGLKDGVTFFARQK